MHKSSLLFITLFSLTTANNFAMRCTTKPRVKRPNNSTLNNQITIQNNQTETATIRIIFKELLTGKHSFVEVPYNTKNQMVSALDMQLALPQINIAPDTYNIVHEGNLLSHVAPHIDQISIRQIHSVAHIYLLPIKK